MKSPALKAAAIVAGLGAFFGLMQLLGIGLPLLLSLGLVLAVVAVGLPWVGVRWFDSLAQHVRNWVWRHEAGRHHAFGGVTLHVEDDGRHLWIAGADLKRVLRSNDRDEVLAARMPGRSRRTSDGRLQLRVDAVVEHLATAPERMDPRRVKLRRYLEQDVLFPAAERRRRGL
jgi:hypothetical protein